jgi:hypothetical protein
LPVFHTPSNSKEAPLLSSPARSSRFALYIAEEIFERTLPMPRKDPDLGLHEELLLLVLKDREGTLAESDRYRFALAGAILAELLLRERLRLVEPKAAAATKVGRWLKEAFSERHLVEVIDDSPTDDPVLNDCLQRIASAKRRASLKTWIGRLHHQTKLRHEVARVLCRKSVLRTEEGKILLIFRRRIYPELNPRPERELIERLRRAIFTSATSLDPRTVILLSLAHAAKLLSIPFEKRTLRTRKKRIESVVHGNLLGKATSEAVQAAHAAASAATYVVIYG